ncbi:MAG TPA: NUDIX domain-containing protein [Candidatus Saccharimonadia bacterium]
MTTAFPHLSPEEVRAHKGKSFTGISVTFMCHDGQGRFFMAQRGTAVRDEPGTWDVGGGGLHFGERTVDGAVREAQEEYGAQVLGEPTLLGFREVFRTSPDGTPTHWIAFDYLLRVDPDSMRLNETDTLSAGGWYTLNDLPSPRHSQMETVYWEKYHDRLRELFSDSSQ